MPDARMVLTHLGRFRDQMVPLLERLVPGVAFTDHGSSDVLVALPTDHDALAQKLTPAVKWIHVLGAGVDGFPLDAVGDRVLTSSRGAAAPAIAEFVLAGMLAFEKQLPERWITEPPAQWNVARLGSLRGKTVGILGLGAIGTEVARGGIAQNPEDIESSRSRDIGEIGGRTCFRRPPRYHLACNEGHASRAGQGGFRRHEAGCQSR